MRKLVWTLFSILVLFTACNSDDDFGITESTSTKTKSNHFYGVKYADTPETRGVTQRVKLWHPTANIKVKFLNGTADLQSKVETYAKEWEQYMSVTFEFVTEGNADVRVGFDWNDERYVTWSYVGTDCRLLTDQSEATMSFAYFDSATDRDIRADVLRTFGQVLGLELEHRHLNFDAGWTTRIADYWEGEIEDIPWESLKQYVFDPLLSGDILQTNDYDPNSIMIWPFTRRYADNTAREQNYDLSEGDIEFIGTLYPIMEERVAIMMKTNGQEGEVGISIDSNDTSITPTIDWGDGTIESYPLDISEDGKSYFFEHTYTGGGEYTIKLYDDARFITRISGNGYPMNEINITKCKNLDYIFLWSTSLETCNVSNSSELRTLMLSGESFTYLDITKNTSIESLDLLSTQISHLDISKNIQLDNLTFYGSELYGGLLSELDVSNNILLEYLTLLDVPISSLNLSKNKYLRLIHLDNTGINLLDVSNNYYLDQISIKNTPLENDISALINFANSLLYRSNRDGEIRLTQNKDHIRDILVSKNWYISGEY